MRLSPVPALCCCQVQSSERHSTNWAGHDSFIISFSLELLSFDSGKETWKFNKAIRYTFSCLSEVLILFWILLVLNNPVWMIAEGTNIRCEKIYVLNSGICPVYKGTALSVSYFMTYSISRTSASINSSELNRTYKIQWFNVIDYTVRDRRPS
jgi:hypothetical protein